MAGGIKREKHYLFLLNFVFAIIGIVLMVLGFIASNYELFLIEAEAEILSDHPVSSDRWTIIGSIVFSLAIFGSFAIINERRSILTSHAVFLLVTFVALIVFIIFDYNTLRNLNGDEMEKDYRNKFNNYSKNEEFLDSFQSNKECCGVVGPSDFNTQNNETIPWSCCPQKNNNSTDDCLPSNSSIYQSGCSSIYAKSYSENIGWVALLLFITGIIQFFGIVSEFYLVFKMQNSGSHLQGVENSALERY